MLKTFSKLLFLLITFSIVISFSICYATEAVTTAETDNTTTTTVTNNSTNSETTTVEDTNYYGDFYISDNEVIIDNVIYGNAYIIGNKVEISGQIEGNLFVIAKELKLDKSYIGGSIYAYADNIYYNNAANYLYAIADKIEMTYDSFVVRDAKIKADTAIIKAAIGRDLYLDSYKINLGENEEIPIIYRNFEYSSPSKITIQDEILTKDSNVSYSYKMPKYLKTIIIISIILIIIIVIIFIIISTKKNKSIKEEAKKQAKENKEKRKQEKFEAKVAKKQAKLEAKKKDNTDL